MNKKAQNIIEVSLMLALVSIVALSVWTIYNNQKLTLTNMTKTNSTVKPVSISTLNSDDPNYNKKIPYNGVETAGALSLLGMSAEDFDTAISKITYGKLKEALNSEGSGVADLLELANTLSDKYSLNASFDPEKVDGNTLDNLSSILNKVALENPISDTGQAFVDKFKLLLTLAGV